MRAILVAAMLVVVTACGEAQRSGADPIPSVSSPDTTATPPAGDDVTGSDPAGGVDGPVMYAPGPASDGGEDALIEGVVTRDGDCLFIGPGAPGERFAALWPFGTTWDAPSDEVVLRDGTRIPLGAVVSAGGGYGSPETLSELTTGSTELAARASDCAEGEYRELAHVQHSITVAAATSTTNAEAEDAAADVRPLHALRPRLEVGVDGSSLARLPLVFDSWNGEAQWPNEPEPTVGIVVSETSELSFTGEYPADSTVSWYVLGDDLRFALHDTTEWNGTHATLPAPPIGTWFVDVRSEYGVSAEYAGAGVLRAGAWILVTPDGASCEVPAAGPRWGDAALVTGVVDADGCPVVGAEAGLLIDALTPWFHCTSWPAVLTWRAADGDTTEYWQHEVDGEPDIVTVPADAVPTGRFIAAGEVLVSPSEPDAVFVRVAGGDAQRWAVPNRQVVCA